MEQGGKGNGGIWKESEMGGGFDQKHIICMYGILKQSTKKKIGFGN